MIWLFFLCIPESPNDLHENFDYVQLIGFFVQTFGTLLFNEIIILKFFGLNKHLTTAVKAEPVDSNEGKPLL